ncbi:site-specific tyrosine recombinase XerC, partial [Dickeya dadantii subsp. dieffenbachiae]
HASVESTQIYTQVNIRALQAVHASTHPAERDPEEETGLLADLMADEAADTPPPDKREKNGYD